MPEKSPSAYVPLLSKFAPINNDSLWVLAFHVFLDQRRQNLVEMDLSLYYKFKMQDYRTKTT